MDEKTHFLLLFSFIIEYISQKLFMHTHFKILFIMMQEYLLQFKIIFLGKEV